ncbi:hyphal wall protein 1-like [Haliotis rufescens]|uniref:hyphal wall protein 1-like n=1 Tax=Haliotis rufescens TaxID=6454 RepID=UPI00201F7863|nr:hyphal wall protein 1-like [Haliotis rufescens]
MDIGWVIPLAVFLVNTVHRVYAECPQDRIPVVDLCGTDPFTDYVFHIQSAGMSGGFSHCSCTLSTTQDNNSVTINPSADVIPSICQAYILVVDGLPRGSAYAWCNRQGEFEAVMDKATPWSVDVVKTSSTAPATDPGHCLLVRGSSLLTVACRNDGTGKDVTRPTTTPTTPTTRVPSRIVTQEPSINTTVTGTNIQTEGPATTEETAATPFITTPSPTANLRLFTTSSPSTVPPVVAQQTSTRMDNEKAIIIGVSVGAVLLLILISVIIYRLCCRNERPVEKYTPHEIPDVKPMTEVVPSSNQDYTTVHPATLYSNKDKLRRVKSSPPGTRPNMLAADDSHIPAHAITADGHLFKETSKVFRQHQLDVFKEGKRNAERVNSGATIEAKRRYITRVAITGSGYSSQPNSRVNSIKRQSGKFVTAEEAFMKRERWYKAEPRSILADSRSRSHSGYLGSL